MTHLLSSSVFANRCLCLGSGAGAGTLLIVLGLFCVPMAALSQELPGWTLVWQDEFTQADGTSPNPANWTFDNLPNGTVNDELQYYTSRTNNARIENNQLVIEAHEESYLGADYTSARLITKDKREFTYGRMEARIKIPYGEGMWPAFWMLGDDIFTTGWPGCGELDIMENVGFEPRTVHGSLHGPGYFGANSVSGGYTLGGADISDDYHVFAVEWDESSIRFYFDDINYFTATPASMSPDPWVFDHDFFFILNVAVGGIWPGPPDNSTVFPQQMLVDYVRVYSRIYNTSTPYYGTPMAVPGIIEAEDFDNGGIYAAFYDTDASNNGSSYRTSEEVDIEACTDTGGGYNVGWTAAYEWMKYTVDVAPAGEYTITTRVASDTGGGAFHIEVDGVDVTGSISVQDTGGWQSWVDKTVSNITLNSGEQVVRLVIENEGFNINHMEFVLDQEEVNTPPQFSTDPISEPNATEDSAYSASIAGSATDANAGDTLIYSKDSGPAWLNVAPGGALSGTPVNDDVGLNSWTIEVSDGVNSPVSATLQIMVDNVNDAPVFVADPIIMPNAYEEIGYNDTLAGSATDPDVGDTLTYSKFSGPLWLNIATNGTLSGTPTVWDVGTTNTWTVWVADGNGSIGSAKLKIFVDNELVPPVLDIQLSGSNLEILWPVSTSGFSLYCSTNLAAPAVWSSVTNLPIVQGDDWMVTLPAAEEPQFYRLQNP